MKEPQELLIKTKSAMNSISDRIAKYAMYFFTTNYRAEGFVDTNFVKWKDKKTANGQPILVKKGALRRSLKITKKTTSLIIISTNIPYAGYHNFGTKKLPQRKFLGKSEALKKECKKIISSEIKKIFNM